MLRVIAAFLLILLATASSHAAPPAVTHYFDEATNRYAIVKDADFGKLTIDFRYGGNPNAYWMGEGTRKEKDIAFSQIVGEDQERGTMFVGKASESKLEVEFKPGQRMPVDAGINGSFRHITDEKRLSLAKKETAAAEDALALALKTAPKMWPGIDRSWASEWKNRWPALRDRWMGLVVPPPPPPAKPATNPPPGAAPKGAEPGTPAPTPEYWLALTGTISAGTGFINTPLDKTMPAEWDGEYDDGFGGHISLRVAPDKGLRAQLNCTRGTGDGHVADMFAKIPAAGITKEKNGDLTATYTHRDTDLKPEEPQAIIKLRKVGHFLLLETQHTQRYTNRAWFDGIYRWSPVPKE